MTAIIYTLNNVLKKSRLVDTNTQIVVILMAFILPRSKSTIFILFNEK